MQHMSRFLKNFKLLKRGGSQIKWISKHLSEIVKKQITLILGKELPQQKIFCFSPSNYFVNSRFLKNFIYTILKLKI